MPCFRRILIAVLLLSVLSPGASWAAAAQKPQDIVRTFYAALTETMKQGKSLGFDGRYARLEPVIKNTFNFPLMTRLAVGFGWARATQAEKDELIDAFSAFSIATYANRFSSYDGEVFTVTGEKKSETGVVVETTLKPKNDDAVMLNYLMRADKDGKFRIVDVFMNGTISELATRRSDFSSIVRRQGIPALIRSLKEKTAQLRAS
ncbi:MAG: ABC transporter substrate-binding protein [Alphaproteobacteria bacterium]|nr:ABC transporter substrate-binding protein [Alphaproteobacteria bacterium]